MKFNGEIVKKGTSQVNDLSIEYAVTFDSTNQPKKVSARVYRDKQLIGQSSLGVIGKQFQLSFYNVEQIAADERMAVYTNVERTIQKLFV